jgi:hypothetical protein
MYGEHIQGEGAEAIQNSPSHITDASAEGCPLQRTPGLKPELKQVASGKTKVDF